MVALFRYGKDGRTRSYGLTTISETAVEVWVESMDARRTRKVRRLAVCDDDEQIEPFLSEIRRELEAGGWSEL